MAKKQKYYVVWEGRKNGIFQTWDECKAQVFEFPTAKYKSFESLAEANNAYKKSYQDYIKVSNRKLTSSKTTTQSILENSLSVDAACSGNPGIMEYQCVKTSTKELVFHRGPFEDGTNNIGEFLGLVHCLALLHKMKNETTAIYSDSITAIAWVRNKKAKTNLQKTKKNGELFDLIERAEKWLSENTYATKILKWDTVHWGEIPADFGRK